MTEDSSKQSPMSVANLDWRHYSQLSPTAHSVFRRPTPLEMRVGDNASSKAMPGGGRGTGDPVLPDSGHPSSEQSAKRSILGDAFR